MTQNVYPSSNPSSTTSSTSTIRHEGDDNQSSNEIRADIDQTRASVGEKIDQLQARLDPSRLKQQAQETVQEMITDTANSMTDYVRTHKDEMVSSLADAARRNPLPTALVGLGVGWLILESISGNRRSEDRYVSEQRTLRPRDDRDRFEGSTGRSFVSQGRGQGMEEDRYSPQYYDAPDYSRGGYPTESGQRVENQGSSQYDREYDQHSGNGHSRNPLAKAADAVKGTVSDVAETVKDTVADMGEGIKERVSNVRHEAMDRVSNVRNEAMGRVGDVRRQAGQMGGQTQQSFQRTGERMQQWERRARFEGQRRGQQAMRNLEDNPLTYGAVALAAGAALALLLPQTRAENRYFGEMRDQVMEKGQEVMETAKSHAQQVVNEVRPELEEKARQIVSDAAELGKEVVKDAKEELRPVVDKALSTTKEQARSAATEVGVNPDKLTGNKPALNRDTMAGQWKQIRGDVKSKWGQLTDDELTQTEGDYEKLAGIIQTRYGYTRERVDQELNDFFNSRKA